MIFINFIDISITINYLYTSPSTHLPRIRVLLHLLGALVRDAGDGLFAAAEGGEHFGLPWLWKSHGKRHGKHRFYMGKPMKNKHN